MALKKYIGARYAPRFVGAWAKSKPYAALDVVYTENRSYVARQAVPPDTEITNNAYWIQSSDWNAQVAEYNEKVEAYQKEVSDYQSTVAGYSKDVSEYYNGTIHAYNTKTDMINDRALTLGQIALTCGNKTLGDAGGSYYEIVDSATVSSVALKNGLFAQPFTLVATDISAFQRELDEYQTEVDESIQQITNGNAVFKQDIESSQTQFEAKINTENTAFKQEINKDTLGVYDTKTQLGQASPVVGKTVLTAGETALGDGGGSFYKIQKGSVSGNNNVATADGNTAVPFTLTPYAGIKNDTLSVGVGGTVTLSQLQSNIVDFDLPKGAGSVTMNLGTVLGSSFVAGTGTISRKRVCVPVVLWPTNAYLVTSSAPTTQYFTINVNATFDLTTLPGSFNNLSDPDGLKKVVSKSWRYSCPASTVKQSISTNDYDASVFNLPVPLTISFILDIASSNNAITNITPSVRFGVTYYSPDGYYTAIDVGSSN